MVMGDDRPTAYDNGDDNGDRGPTPSPLSNRVTSSTPCKPAEQSLNMSSLVNSSMEMCNTSLDMAVVAFDE